MSLEELKKKKFEERRKRYGDDPMSYSLMFLVRHLRKEFREFWDEWEVRNRDGMKEELADMSLCIDMVWDKLEVIESAEDIQT